VPNQHSRQSLEKLVPEIRELHGSVEVLASNFRNALRELEKHETRSPTRYSARYWSFAVLADSLVRVRLLIEQNFMYFETLGVLALTRYVFELIDALQDKKDELDEKLDDEIYRLQVSPEEYRRYQEALQKDEGLKRLAKMAASFDAEQRAELDREIKQASDLDAACKEKSSPRKSHTTRRPARPPVC
jgi:hypothetical protein